MSQKMLVFAIDPGNQESGYCLVSAGDYKPLKFGKVPNDELLSIIAYSRADWYVIERVASYGMAVGREVFETCEWVGRYTQIIKDYLDGEVRYIYRKEEKQIICHSLTAKDANLRRALIDQFAKHDFKQGKGTKKHPDFFYGFHADVWAAYCVAYAFIKIRLEGMG